MLQQLKRVKSFSILPQQPRIVEFISNFYLVGEREHRPQLDGNQKDSSGDLGSYDFDVDYCEKSSLLRKPRRHDKFV